MLNALAARFEGEPSLVAPGADARVDACLQAVMRLPRADDMLSESFPAHATADDGFWPAPDSWKAAYRPYVVSDGVLQIPVKGVLLNDFPWAIGYATGYVYILRAALRGIADPQVRGLALICDTPGGMVAGNFDLVDKLYALRGAKPIRAFAHEAAYSAGYSIASAADRIIVSRTGGVGSIGVVTGHVDRSKALEADGLKVTFIFAGKHKVDGNPTEPLAPGVKARMQARIDRLYGVFVATVARNRAMPEAAVRATEALTYTAEEAVTEGLADVIGSLDDEVAAFAAEISPPDEDTSMITPEAHQTAVSAARAEGEAAGRAAGVKEGTASAHARITAVLGDDKVKGRESAAVDLALASPDMAASAVVAFVSKHGAAATAPAGSGAGSRLDAVMSDVSLEAQGGTTSDAGAADPWGSVIEGVNTSAKSGR